MFLVGFLLTSTDLCHRIALTPWPALAAILGRAGDVEVVLRPIQVPRLGILAFLRLTA